jgi:hypothetical protein
MNDNYERRMNNVWTLYERCVNGVWTTYEHCMNALWTLCERLLNALWTPAVWTIWTDEFGPYERLMNTFTTVPDEFGMNVNSERMSLNHWKAETAIDSTFNN